MTFKRDWFMKLYWKQLHEETKLQILISEYVHLKKLDVIENWVKLHQVRELEEELVKRGVIWDRNCDLQGSEHLYVESAIVHVDTYFRAHNAKLGALRLFSLEHPAGAISRLRVAAIVIAILAVPAVLFVWWGAMEDGG